MTKSTNSPRAERFLARIEEAYDRDSMSPAELELIEECVYTINLLTRLRAEIASGELTERRTGGNRMRPVVVEARLQSQALMAMLRAFPAIDAEEV